MSDRPRLGDISEAVQRIKNGDSESFWDLVSPYQRSLYATAYSLLENTEDVKEVVQETMLKAHKSLDSLRDVQCLRAWLHRIAINEARMKLRGARGEISYDENEGAGDDFRPRDYADWKDIPSTAVERKEIRDAIQRALRSLTPALREVFALRDIQEFSVPEVSQILGIREAQVSLRLHRARLRMREFLAPIFRSGRSPWMPLQMMPDMPAMLIHRVIRCKSVIREISNFINNDLEPALRAEIEKHLKYCRRCRILLDTTSRVLYLVADEKVYLPPFSLDTTKSTTVDP